MINLTTGQFYGQTNELLQLEGLTLTDTEYTHDWVDWHFHENAYFTFILDGLVLEGNKKESYHCSTGSLLFHHWQESHYNKKPPGFTRGFHIELEHGWLANLDLDIARVQGSLNIADPQVKVLLYKIFKESKVGDAASSPAIQSLLIEALSKLNGHKTKAYRTPPSWVVQLKELLNDAPATDWTLTTLAETVDIHPVHLSRSFTQHFQCTLGQYLRMAKVQRALTLLPGKNRSLTEIALECGFADQSHFIRCFKEVYQTTPSDYRMLLAR